MSDDVRQAARDDDDRLVTVCDKCRRACCWYGIYLCDRATWAGTVQVPVGVLRKEKRESPDYWTDRAVTEGGIR